MKARSSTLVLAGHPLLLSGRRRRRRRGRRRRRDIIEEGTQQPPEPQMDLAPPATVSSSLSVSALVAAVLIALVIDTSPFDQRTDPFRRWCAHQLQDAVFATVNRFT